MRRGPTLADVSVRSAITAKARRRSPNGLLLAQYRTRVLSQRTSHFGLRRKSDPCCEVLFRATPRVTRKHPFSDISGADEEAHATRGVLRKNILPFLSSDSRVLLDGTHRQLRRTAASFIGGRRIFNGTTARRVNGWNNSLRSAKRQEDSKSIDHALRRGGESEDHLLPPAQVSADDAMLSTASGSRALWRPGQL